MTHRSVQKNGVHVLEPVQYEDEMKALREWIATGDVFIVKGPYSVFSDATQPRPPWQ